MDSFVYFSNNIGPIIVLVIGLIGNLLGFIVLFSKKLKKFGPTLIYKLLFVCDTIFLVQIVIFYMQNGLSFDPTIFSPIGCKIFFYFNYGLDALSPWLLVYISIERYVAIGQSPAKGLILKKKKNQIIYFFILCAYNAVYHLNIPFSADIIITSPSNDSINETSQIYCNFIDYTMQSTTIYMDLINCVLLPICLMLCFSILLILAIFRSRAHVQHSNKSSNEHRNLKKEIKMSISILLLNLFFALVNIPIEIILFLPNYLSFQFVINIYFLSYSLNFYILVLVNSLFRKEFFNLFRTKKMNRQHRQHQTRTTKL